MTDPPPVRRVSAAELREMFNTGGYLQQIQDGQLQAVLRADKHPSAPRAQEPVCTRSQYTIYLDAEGQEVAHAHQYLRTDGNLGASGRPDPKRLLVNGILYIVDVEGA